MMECDEIIDHINAAELLLENMRKLRQGKHKPSVLAVAAFAFAEMSDDYDPTSFADECRQLFQLVYWAEQLRLGNDPRCGLCKQNEKLRTDFRVHAEVLQ